MTAMRSLETVAREVAAAHCEQDPDTTAVYLVPDPAGAEIRLVEVSRALGTVGEILPYRFKPTPERGVPYATVIILLSPADWEQLQQGQLELPQGWGRPVPLDQLDPAA